METKIKKVIDQYKKDLLTEVELQKEFLLILRGIQ